jgi:hypothetical protein
MGRRAARRSTGGTIIVGIDAGGAAGNRKEPLESGVESPDSRPRDAGYAALGFVVGDEEWFQVLAFVND